MCVSERWGELSRPSVHLYLFLWHPRCSRLPWTHRMTPWGLIRLWLIFCMWSSCVMTSWHSFFSQGKPGPRGEKGEKGDQGQKVRWKHLFRLDVSLFTCLYFRFQAWLDLWLSEPTGPMITGSFQTRARGAGHAQCVKGQEIIARWSKYTKNTQIFAGCRGRNTWPVLSGSYSLLFFIPSNFIKQQMQLWLQKVVTLRKTKTKSWSRLCLVTTALWSPRSTTQVPKELGHY